MIVFPAVLVHQTKNSYHPTHLTHGNEESGITTFSGTWIYIKSRRIIEFCPKFSQKWKETTKRRFC